MAPGARTITEPGMRPATKPGLELAIELGAGATMESRAGLATKSGARPTDIEKSLVPIVFIIIINISTSGLHNLIRTYSNKKQANYYSKSP